MTTHQNPINQNASLPSRNESTAAHGQNQGNIDGVLGNSRRPLSTQPVLQVTEDPLMNFIQDNWRSMVVTVLAVAALAYGWNVYQSTNTQAQQSSGDSFVALQRSHDEFVNGAASQAAQKDPAATDAQTAARARFESQVKSLSFAKAPYPALAGYYEQLGQISGNSDSAKAARNKVLEESAYRNASTDSLPRITAELLFMSAARSLASDADAKTRAQGWKALEQLTTDAVYVAGAAATSLKSFATTEQEKAAAESAVQIVLGRQPELTNELKADGLGSED